jgi:hypothetical protein
MILEGNNVFVPAGHLTGDTNRDQFGEPNDVTDFHLAKLNISVESGIVESVFECHGVSAGLGQKHNIIDALTASIELGTSADLVKHGLIFESTNGSLQLVEGVCIRELLALAGVEITKLANVFVSVGLATGI